MGTKRKIATCDCETDPFDGVTIIRPFIWGYYDGKSFLVFNTTQEFFDFICTKPVILYAHNGGKFDFMYLLSFIPEGVEIKCQVINGRIVAMRIGEAELVDSFAAVPQGLGTIKKDEIAYWKMAKHCRADHMEEITAYLKSDCIYLYELMAAYRDAAGTKKTIASNALAFARKQGIDPGKSNYRFDNLYRPFYFGGRTECFQPGSWENISVYDIRSSYPRAMQEHHPTGTEFKWQDDFTDMDDDEISRAFIVLKCYADGCFPLRDGIHGLQFPRAHGEYRVTGWEYLAARDLGLIEDVELISVRYTDDSITFAPYVQHWFDYKQRHNKKTDPINYTIGKIMMNSLYGKLAQDAGKYSDYKIVPTTEKLPCNSPHPDAKGKCKICGYLDIDHGWSFYTKFEGKTFWRRDSLWKHKYRLGVEWEAKPLYKNVATGASITGYARASLLRAIHAVGREHVIYCDTDSLVVTQFANVSKLPQSDEIGDWECEINRAPTGHFCGKKLYAIDIDVSKKCRCVERDGHCPRHKVVTKGARLTFKEIEAIASGEEILYEPQAPSFSLANGIGFIDRRIRKTAQ